MKNKKDEKLFSHVFNFCTSEKLKYYSSQFKLTYGEKTLYLILATYNGPKGICPGMDLLASRMECSVRHVRNFIASLKEKKLLHEITISGKKSEYILFNYLPTKTFLEAPKVIHTPEQSFRGTTDQLLSHPGTIVPRPRNDCSAHSIDIDFKIDLKDREQVLRKDRVAPLSEFLSDVKSKNQNHNLLEAPVLAPLPENFIVFSNRVSKKNNHHSPPGGGFTSSEENKKLAAELNLNLEIQIKSFLLKCKKTKTPENFTNWLLSAHEYQERQNRFSNSSAKIKIDHPIVPRESPKWDETHPGYRAEKEHEEKMRLEKAERDARRNAKSKITYLPNTKTKEAT